MLNKTRVNLLAFENSKIGYGHVKRLKLLHEHLKKRYVCKLYINKIPKTQKIHKKEILILDSHFPNKNLIKKLNKNFIIIGLDYFGKIKIEKNIIILKHKKTFEKKSHIGMENIIIDKENLNKYSKLKIIKNNVLVFFGSSNKRNLTKKYTLMLKKYGYKVITVIGKFNKEKINLVSDNRVTCKKSSKTFYKLLKTSEIVFVNSATTLFEAMYFKKKIWSLPQTNFEKNIYKKIFHKKLIELHKINQFDQKKMIKNSPTYKKINFDGENKIKKIIQSIIKSEKINA